MFVWDEVSLCRPDWPGCIVYHSNKKNKTTKKEKTLVAKYQEKQKGSQARSAVQSPDDFPQKVRASLQREWSSHVRSFGHTVTEGVDSSFPETEQTQAFLPVSRENSKTDISSCTSKRDVKRSKWTVSFPFPVLMWWFCNRKLQVAI